MARTVVIGNQDFEEIRVENYFYVDKTDFIKEWWESGDTVTLIARPRRFGKTLNMNMLNCFFSLKYENRGDLFEGLSIWGEEKYRNLQGTYPVLKLSFANVKEKNYARTVYQICQLLKDLYEQHNFLLQSEVLSESEKEYFRRMTYEVSEADASLSIYRLSDFLSRHYGKKPIILLDEYDTPMQEAYVCGFWDEMISFTRSLFNSTFKTNPYLGRAIMTGITRVSKESVFSDLNNLEVITTTSEQYATAFGFTEEEVFAGLEECGLADQKEKVKLWYDGFVFGGHSDIYNPWSIINFLKKKRYFPYWTQTSSNGLVSSLIQKGSPNLKQTFERLLKGEHLFTFLEEQIAYNQLNGNEAAIWSLLVASGYLKILSFEDYSEISVDDEPKYEIAVTNQEVRRMFHSMIHDWFKKADDEYNEFLQALLNNDRKAMNAYMNDVALKTFSYFDVGSRPSNRIQPERFYHGFVLGLMVDLQKRYIITSNRESGFGRYDVVLEPRSREGNDCAYILEFKVHEPEDEKDLQETVAKALVQIEEKQYAQDLMDRGIPAEKIKKYGFAFEGKAVLIG